MKAYVKLAEATTPEGDLLELYQHDQDFFISCKGERLMTSVAYGSEEELARMACQPFRMVRQPKVLIGGLGMGFTLRAALESLSQSKATVVVSEIIPEVIDWNKEYLDPLHPDLLSDDRIAIKVGAVQKVINGANKEYHAIMLDVDNGPSAFMGEDNDSLYSPQGLASAREALKDGGLLAVWSAYADPKFTKLLRKAGFDVSIVEVPAAHKGRKRRMHTIWLAKKGHYVTQNRAG